MKIGIVSTDGKNVNDHFGKAERFLIYEAGTAGVDQGHGTEDFPPVNQ